MEIATLIIAIVALGTSIVTAIVALYNFLKTRSDSKFRFHFTCDTYEENNKLFCNLIFINSSLEPYSVLRIDYLLGKYIQFIGINELTSKSPSTLVPPREVTTIKGLSLAFEKREFLKITKDPKALNCIKVYTTKRNDPYCIHLRSGLDDSVQKVEKPKQNKERQKQKAE